MRIPPGPSTSASHDAVAYTRRRFWFWTLMLATLNDSDRFTSSCALVISRTTGVLASVVAVSPLMGVDVAAPFDDIISITFMNWGSDKCTPLDPSLILELELDLELGLELELKLLDVSRRTCTATTRI